MRFFFHIILLSFIWVEYSLTTGNNYIQCTSRCSSITLAFNDSASLENECHESDRNNFEASLACTVEYRIDYRSQQININFKGINETELFDAREQNQYFLQTISSILSDDNHEGVQLTRTFYCTMKDDCARSFYLNTIGLLIAEENTAKLISIKHKLYNHSVLMNEHSKRRCIDSDRPNGKPNVLCPMGPCFASLTYDDAAENKEVKTQKCHSERNSYLKGEIKYHITGSSSHKQESIHYRCNKNVCNRDDMIHKVKQILDEYTSWDSSKQTMPIIQTKQLGSLSTKSMVASTVLVLLSLSFHFFI